MADPFVMYALISLPLRVAIVFVFLLKFTTVFFNRLVKVLIQEVAAVDIFIEHLLL